ncbi:hypothetical protein H311_01226 [Anncaliia algerae PRA109]|nr:hypothetical protein H311_01226 [Anncaliia algerae PRA109]
MDVKLLIKEFHCATCNACPRFVQYTRNNYRFAWRCMHNRCREYKKYFNPRHISFFENFRTSLRIILKILIKYSYRQSHFSIIEGFNLEALTIKNLFLNSSK